MAIIKKQINDTNASFRNINAGDAKNTDLFLDQNQRAFFGEKENIDVRLHKNNLAQAILFIASVLPRKYDCSSVHKKIFYSSEFVIDSLRKLDGFFGDADEKIVTWHIRQAVEQKNGKIDDRFYLNNLIQQFSYIDANGKSCESKFTIRDYLAGGYSSIEFHSKENGSVYDFYVTNSNEYQENYGAEQDKENDDIEKSESRNRILFGAPGTGKSWLLNKDASEKFDGRIGQKELDDDEKIKTLVQSVGSDLSLRLSIGVKFESKLKSLTPKEIQTRYSCDGRIAYRICQGAKIKDISSKLQDLSGDDLNAVNIVGEIDKISSDRQASYAAIGYKYAPFFYECTYGDVAKILGFAGDTTSTVQWISAGAKIRENQDDGSLESREKMSYIERVTFHPHYSYAQFVGTYKPVQDEEDSKSVVYSYVPGPFMRTYVRAKRAEQNKTDEKFLLIIEEINRANVAAVFGDVFQLLDRKIDGESEYPVAASEDIKRYLKDNGIADCNELKIPSNMYIWATMNSADQGVFPMDTAFKRRWEFEYIGVNDKKEEIEEFEIPMQEKKDVNGNPIKDADGNVTHEWMNWNKLRTQINDKLTTCGKNEDKLLGPFFISMEKLESVNGHNEKEAVNFVKSFKSKVLMYLFEDVCKMRPGDLFNCDKMRYSEICKKFDTDGIGVFNF